MGGTDKGVIGQRQRGERHQKACNQKIESTCQLLQDTINIISSCASKIQKVQGRYISGISIMVVRSNTSHHLWYCNERLDVMLHCLSLFVPYFSG